MEHTIESLAQEHHVGGGRKEIYHVTLILSVFTVIELGLGIWLMYVTADLPRHLIKGVIIIFMLAKAFYIVGYFMHLKHEIRNLIMTIVVPLFLFVWFITAFLTDGNSFKNLKNSLDRGHQERSHQTAPAKPENEEHKME